MWGLPTASYHPAKSDGHSYCRTTDISFLNLSRNQVIKMSRDFEGEVPSMQVTTLPSLVVIGIAEGQI